MAGAKEIARLQLPRVKDGLGNYYQGTIDSKEKSISEDREPGEDREGEEGSGGGEPCRTVVSPK